MKRGIQKELLISAMLITAVTVFATGLLLIWVLTNAAGSRTRDYLEQRNSAIVYFIEGYFGELYNTIEVLAADREVINAEDLGEDAHERVLSRYRAFAEANDNILFLYSGYRGGLMLIDDWDPPEDFDHRTRPWYETAMMRPGEVILGEPYLDAATGGWIISPARTLIDAGGERSGVIAIDCSIDRIAGLLAEEGEYADSVSFVLDRTGRIIIHHDQTRLGTEHPLSGEGVVAGGGHVSYQDQPGAGARRGYLSSVDGLDWIVVTEVDNRRIMTTLFRTILANVLLLLVIVVLLGCAQTYVLGRRFTRPILEIAPFLEDVARGDFTGTLPIRGDNEITTVARNVNAVMDEFASILSHVRRSLEQLTEQTRKLRTSSEETAAITTEQSTAVTQLVSTTEEAGTLARRVEKNIDGIAAATTETVRTVQAGVESVQSILARMEDISQANARTIEGIDDLVREIESIWEILQIINGITEQTRIIAFSAELEASSAEGESGRNFQIVSTEIRRLADSTVQSTAQIRKRLEEVHSSSVALKDISRTGTGTIEDGRAQSREVGGLFEGILQRSRESARMASDSTALVQQQNTSIEQIILTLHQLAEGIHSAAAATTDTKQVTDTLHELGKQLEQHMKQYRVASHRSPSDTSSQSGV